MRLAVHQWASRWLLLLFVPLVACTSSQGPSATHSQFITDRESQRVIVFIHGLFGDANKTWFNSDNNAYWPSLFDQDPVFREKYAIYVVDYGSPYIEQTSTIEEVATRIHQQLIDKHFFERFKEIYFVTHSMGGLVAKRILVELNRPNESPKLRQVRAVLFLSTPALGAELAEIGAWLSMNPQVNDLKTADFNGFLQILENQWQNVLRDREKEWHLFPRSYCAYETLATFGVKIVSRVYATTRCDANPNGFERNHLDIVKPYDERDEVYEWAKGRIQEAAKLIEIDPEAALNAYKLKYENELAKIRDEKLVAEVEARSWEKAYEVAVRGLTQKQTMPEAPPGIHDALTKLAEGETADAKEIFQQILHSKKSQGHAANQEAAEAARHLGALAFVNDTHSALEAYREAVTLDPADGSGWTQLGRLFVRIGSLEEAEASFQKVMELGKNRGDGTLMAIGTSDLGIVYLIRGEPEKAKRMFQDSLKLAEELSQKAVVASNYTLLGLINWNDGNSKEAEKYYLKSLKLEEELGNKEGMASNYTNLGIVYGNEGYAEKAEGMFNTSLELEIELDHKEGIARNYSNLGLLYSLGNDRMRAKDFFEKSLERYKEVDYKEGMAKVYANLGLLYRSLNEIKQAKDMITKSIQLFREAGAELKAKQMEMLINQI